MCLGCLLAFHPMHAGIPVSKYINNAGMENKLMNGFLAPLPPKRLLHFSAYTE